MDMILSRPGEQLKIAQYLWRTLVIAAADRGWTPGPMFPGQVPSARTAAAAGVMNAWFDDVTAGQFAQGVRDALERSPWIYRRQEPATKVRLRPRVLAAPTFRARFEPLAAFLDGRPFTVRRWISLLSDPHGDKLFEIDLRGWCQLQVLAHGRHGWLPGTETQPWWLAPELTDVWQASRRPTRDVAADLDQRSRALGDHMQNVLLDSWADAVEEGLKQCPIEDALVTVTQSGGVVPDAVPARPEEWFTGLRRRDAVRFVDVLRAEPYLKIA